jgi:UDP-N-acetylmuramate--alanine ligase
MTRYHIVGIGGAGMSGIAHILLDRGHTVQGTDTQPGAFAAQLAARGAAIVTGHSPAAIAGADALIATSAVRDDHPELVAARERGIPVLRRHDLWREWSHERQVVAVAGTHGKTTTTALIALALTEAGRNPGFLIGGEVPDLQVNARWGDSQAPLVIEADEYERTFLALTPSLTVITNVEWDHVDIYPSPEAYAAAFRRFAHSVPDPRRVIVCGDDAGAVAAVDLPQATQYGIDETIARDPASCRLAPLDWSAANVRADGELTHFEVWRYSQQTFATSSLGPYTLRLSGLHNVRNALAAAAACDMLLIAPHTVRAALARYCGTKRRFELKGEAGGVTVVDDYAHHPTEVQATLAAARARFPGRRLVVYLQPHTYTRTAALAAEWAGAFADADVVRIGAVYAAREAAIPGVDAHTVAARIEHADVAATGGIDESAAEIVGLLRPGDVLLTLGAGDGFRVGEMVLGRLGVARFGIERFGVVRSEFGAER